MEGHYNKIPAENQLLLSFFSGIWDASDSLDSLGVLSFFAALVALQCRVYTGFQTDAASRLAILFRLDQSPHLGRVLMGQCGGQGVDWPSEDVRMVRPSTVQVRSGELMEVKQ